MTRKLSTAEVGRILGMSEARVRELVRSGLGRPARRGRRYAFSFQDLVILRTAQELIAQDVPTARVVRSLSSLARQLCGSRPLSGLRIFAEGGRVAVQEGPVRWHPDTGQIVLDFEPRTERVAVPDPGGRSFAVGELEEQTAKVIALPAAVTGARRDAMAEFERALELEDEDPLEACSAYGRALELDPELVDAYVNLGRIAHESGNGVEAIRLYELALERTPLDPVLHYNLALAVEDTRGARAAVPHYERALELAPDFADAHYNLAALCEKLDRPQDALRHYHAYKRLTEGA